MATLPADISAPSRHRLTVADYRRMGETGIIAADDRVEPLAEVSLTLGTLLPLTTNGIGR